MIDNGPDQIPPPPEFARRGIPLAMKVGIGCLSGCALVIALLIVAGFLAARRGGESMVKGDEEGRKFIQLIKQNRSEDAYAMTADAWKRSSSLQEMKKFVGLWRQQTGEFVEVALKNKWWYSGIGGTRVTLAYYVRGSKSVEQISIVLITEGSDLKIGSCDFTPRPSFDSPLKLNGRG